MSIEHHRVKGSLLPVLAAEAAMVPWNAVSISDVFGCVVRVPDYSRTDS